jgi:hypothetical protein
MAIEQTSTNPHSDVSPSIAAQTQPGVRVSLNHKLAIKNFFACGLGKTEGERLFDDFMQRLFCCELTVESKTDGNWREAIQSLVIPELTSCLPTPASQIDLEADLQTKFQFAWRQSLLKMTWDQLKELQDNFGKRFYTVLKSRVKHSNWSTERLYKSLLESGDAVCGPSAFKECLRKAHTTYAKFLFSEVLNTFSNPSELQIKTELQLLGLHHFFPANQSGSHSFN